MTNKQIMEQAVEYTTSIYKQVNYSTKVQTGKITYEGLKQYAAKYSAECLKKAIESEDGICIDYPKTNNIRDNIASIGKNGLINELLKNAISVAVYHILKETDASKIEGCSYFSDMSDDQTALVIFNNLVCFGADKLYTLLSNEAIMDSLCKLFAKYRGKEYKDILDYVAQSDKRAKYHISELQTYYENIEPEKVNVLK